MKKISYMLLIGLLAATLGACAAKPAATEGQPPATETAESAEEAAGIAHEPEAAPPFTLKSLKGETVSLDDYQGEYVMINFWATWCKYCDQEMPDLAAFQKKHAGEVTVLAINVGEDEKTVQAYVDKKKLELEVLMDVESEVAGAYLVSAFPTTFLIDRSGKVIGYIPGMMTAEDMETSFNYLKANGTTE